MSKIAGSNDEGDPEKSLLLLRARFTSTGQERMAAEPVAFGYSPKRQGICSPGLVLVAFKVVSCKMKWQCQDQHECSPLVWELGTLLGRWFPSPMHQEDAASWAARRKEAAVSPPPSWLCRLSQTHLWLFFS